MAKKEIRVLVKLVNNVLWHAIFDNYKSLAAFGRAKGFHPERVGKLLYLKESPLNREGEYRRFCGMIAQAVDIEVEELFPLWLYRLAEQTAEIEMAIADLPDGGAGVANVRDLLAHLDREKG